MFFAQMDGTFLRDEAKNPYRDVALLKDETKNPYKDVSKERKRAVRWRKTLNGLKRESLCSPFFYGHEI